MFGLNFKLQTPNFRETPSTKFENKTVARDLWVGLKFGPFYLRRGGNLSITRRLRRCAFIRMQQVRTGRRFASGEFG